MRSNLKAKSTKRVAFESSALARVMTFTLTTGVAILFLAGCSGSGLPEMPPAPTLAPADLQAALDSNPDARWANVVSMYPDAVRPDTELVRMIDGNEWLETQLACL